jgi:hypothetical protein
MTDISHLAAVSQSGALLTYRRTCVYSRVLYFHFLTSSLPVTYLSSLISLTLPFWRAFCFLFLFFFPAFCTLPYRPWGLPTVGPHSFPRVKRPGRGHEHPHHLAQRLKKKSITIRLFSLLCFMAGDGINFYFTLIMRCFPQPPV